MEEKQAIVSINKNSSFTEIWYEGSVEFNGKTHNFPMEVRRMHDQIVEAYYESQNKKQND